MLSISIISGQGFLPFLINRNWLLADCSYFDLVSLWSAISILSPNSKTKRVPRANKRYLWQLWRSSVLVSYINIYSLTFIIHWRSLIVNPHENFALCRRRFLLFFVSSWIWPRWVEWMVRKTSPFLCNRNNANLLRKPILKLDEFS